LEPAPCRQLATTTNPPPAAIHLRAGRPDSLPVPPIRALELGILCERGHVRGLCRGLGTSFQCSPSAPLLSADRRSLTLLWPGESLIRRCSGTRPAPFVCQRTEPVRSPGDRLVTAPSPGLARK